MIEIKNSEDHTTIKDERALLDFIDTKIMHNTEREITIVCAGHFMLLPDKTMDKVFPGIFESEKNGFYENARSAIGIFPQYTWKIGCKIIDGIKKRKQLGKLSLLVNDWQLVPVDQHREESKPNRFRDTFYKEFKDLPSLYKREFELHNLSVADDIYRTEDGEFYLREVRLRDRFLRKIKSFVRQDVSVPIGMCTLTLDDSGNISLCAENNPSYALTINSQAGCAGGIAQMIIDISDRLKSEYYRINFINLMPKGCTMPVNIASELAINILQEEASQIDVSVLNIYFNSNGTADEEDFYNYYDHEVTCYEFKSKNYV